MTFSQNYPCNNIIIINFKPVFFKFNISELKFFTKAMSNSSDLLYIIGPNAFLGLGLCPKGL